MGGSGCRMGATEVVTGYQEAQCHPAMQQHVMDWLAVGCNCLIYILDWAGKRVLPSPIVYSLNIVYVQHSC